MATKKKARIAVKIVIYGLVLLLLLLLIGTAVIAISVTKFRRSDRLAPHLTIGGVPVGGLTRAEAQRRLEQEWLPTLPAKLVVQVGNERFELSCARLGRQPQLDKAVAAAWRVGREGTLFAQWWTRLRLLRTSLDIPVPLYVDEDTLRAEVARLARKVDRPPVDAAVDVSDDDVVNIIPGRPGRTLDQSAAVTTLREALLSQQREPVVLSYRQTAPRVTEKDLAQLEVVLASYSTPFNPAKKDRTHNLRLAIQAINKHVILPGEEFSTDRTIGPRIAERGFREAPIFQDGEVTPATGGGICQIATTIYNAALLAGLEIIERHHHSQPVPYVPAGRDATVYAGQLDLRFRNNTGAPILLLGSVTSDHVIVKIIGSRKAKKEIRLLTVNKQTIPYETKEVPDPTLEIGKRRVEKKGRPGVKVTLVRLITLPDGRQERETLHTDLYRPQAEIVHVGTKPAYYTGPDGKPILGPDGKPIPIKLGPDGKPLPHKPPQPSTPPTKQSPSPVNSSPSSRRHPAAEDATTQEKASPQPNKRSKARDKAKAGDSRSEKNVAPCKAAFFDRNKTLRSGQDRAPSTKWAHEAEQKGRQASRSPIRA